MNPFQSTLRTLLITTFLASAQLSTHLWAAEDAPYILEYSRDTLLFTRANTRQQDFGVELIVTGPNDFQWQQRFSPADPVFFSLLDTRGNIVSDGQYNFELALLSPPRQRSETPLVGGLDKLDGIRQSGVFSINKGTLINPQAQESSGQRDQTIVDDLIVFGSICAGTDCVNGESFDFDTIRLRENNLRIRFVDTSNSASFPSTDWELVANDTTNGGSNRFSIEDLSSARVPFTVEGGTPNHSVYLDSSGRVGFGTSTPLLDLHILSSNTPALRFDQDSGGGFPAQVWDMGGNESEFFIRDTTQISTPLRIIPGAPSDSIHIGNNGDLGFGTNSPSAEIHLLRQNNGPSISYESVGTPNRRWETGINDSDGDFRIDDSTSGVTELVVRGGGNLEIAGTLITTRQPELPKLDQRQALMSLTQLQAYINRHQQLPGIHEAHTSSQEKGFASGANGIQTQSENHDVVSFQMLLLEKLQELTLYTLQQEQRIRALEAELAQKN